MTFKSWFLSEKPRVQAAIVLFALTLIAIFVVGLITAYSQDGITGLAAVCGWFAWLGLLGWLAR